MTTFLEAAQVGYKSLLFRWNNMSIVTGASAPSASFWITGNTLQTFFDYWIRCRQPADQEVVSPILSYFYTVVRPNINSDDLDNIADRALNLGKLWLDDFGWWGNAFATACENAEALKLSGDDVNVFLQAAINCWQLMHRGWDLHSELMPGGVWNTKKAAMEPSDPDLHGRNNVTNTQFWLLSLRLAVLDPKNKTDYLSRWQDIRKHFEELSTANLLLNDAQSKAYFVRERFKGEVGEKWTDGFFWAGDQGLFVHCMELDNRNTPPFSDVKNQVLDYVLSNMCDEAGVLHDQRIVTTDYFNNDYATGKGVFFKNIYKTAQATNNARLFNCIYISAACAWFFKKPVTENPWMFDFTFGWNDRGSLPIAGNWDTSDNGIDSDFRKLILHVSAMDVLNTAAALNPSGIIAELAVR